MTKTCGYCLSNKGIYNVIPPVCLHTIGSTVPVCPGCFQIGIDSGAIVWYGDKPYGICDCEQEHTVTA